MKTPRIDAEAFNAFEARGWERRAHGYHDFFAPITSHLIEPLLDATGVGRGTRVLDVATGPGYLAAAAADRRGAEATGLDIAAPMVELAASLHSKPRFIRGDAELLPFDSGSFDAAIANFAVLHVARPERMAAAMARVLRPGGSAAITVWDAPERSRLLGVFVDAVAQAGASGPGNVPAGPDFFRFAAESELEGLLVDAGFAEVDVETIEFRHRLAGAAELWDGVLAGTVRIRALVEGQEEETKRRIRTAFDQIVSKYESGGGVELPVSVKVASALRPVEVRS